jgi:hypothetical protein
MVSGAGRWDNTLAQGFRGKLSSTPCMGQASSSVLLTDW